MKCCDYLIVGAGITGITAASILARDQGKKVVVVEKRSHIGGNCYDGYNEEGILIHYYGPHIFHTNHGDVWNYLSRYTKWLPYVHRVKAWVDKKYVSFPINIMTFEDLFKKKFTQDDVKEWLNREKKFFPEIRNAEEMVLSQMGQFIYDKFFKNYTKKQWGVEAGKLAPEITQRIPFRLNRDDRYFTDAYQGLPLNGYTVMFENMLKHENIEVVLDMDYKKIIHDLTYEKMIFTGSVDAFFDYEYGALPYRGIDFMFKTFDEPQRLPVAVVNYPNDFDYTRATEFKQMTSQEHSKTTLCYEIPVQIERGEKGPIPSYPILDKVSKVLLSKYKTKIENLDDVMFLGRLGTFQYLNMDACVKQTMDAL